MNDSNFYIIKSGDSFWSLENRWGLPCGTLQDLNPNLAPTKLKVGQKIKIPIINLVVILKESSNRNYPHSIDKYRQKVMMPIDKLRVRKPILPDFVSGIGRIMPNHNSFSRPIKTTYNGLDTFEYIDETIAGIEAYTDKLKHKGGYVAYSRAKTGKGLYWKPNARGLNNLKGYSFNVTRGLKIGGTATAIALEAPEIYYGFKISNQEGIKQFAGGVGSVGGGIIGGWAVNALTGAVAGLAGIELGPGVIVTVIVGAAIGGYLGEEGMEQLYDEVIEKISQ